MSYPRNEIRYKSAINPLGETEAGSVRKQPGKEYLASVNPDAVRHFEILRIL